MKSKCCPLTQILAVGHWQAPFHGTYIPFLNAAAYFQKQLAILRVLALVSNFKLGMQNH